MKFHLVVVVVLLVVVVIEVISCITRDIHPLSHYSKEDDNKASQESHNFHLLRVLDDHNDQDVEYQLNDMHVVPDQKQEHSTLDDDDDNQERSVLKRVLSHDNRHQKQQQEEEHQQKFLLSVVILTYNKASYINETLKTLLPDVITSHLFILPWRFEVIIVDNGCFITTRNVIDYHLELNKTTIKYVPLCNNTQYSFANNLAVEKYVDSSSKWLLFLNDDVIPRHHNTSKHFYGSGFLWNFNVLISVYDKRRSFLSSPLHDVGAVSCKMIQGKHLITEAGSSILSNGKTSKYLR